MVIKTGYEKLDSLTGGLKPGLWVVGGRPGMGKTTFCVNLAANLIKSKYKVAYVDTEGLGREITAYLISIIGNINIDVTTYRKMKEITWQQYYGEMAKIKKMDFTVDFRAYNADNIYEKVKKTCESGCDVIIIDGLQMILQEFKSPVRADFTEIAKVLQELSKDFCKPIIVASNLSRDAENRPGPDRGRPALADLRQYGEIERYADYVILLYQRHLFMGEDGIAGPLKPIENIEIIVAKNSTGACGDVKFLIDRKTLRMSEE